MKIVYIYTAICTKGGVDRVLTVKANYLADAMGHEVYIITESQADRPLAFPISPNVRHIDLGVDFAEQYHKPNLLSRFLCYRRLMKEYRRRLTAKLLEIRPDIVSSMCGREMDFLCDIPDGSKKIGESHIAKNFMRNFHLMEAKGFPHNLIARYYRRKQERAIARLDALVVLTQNDAESWRSVRPCVIIPNPITVAAGVEHNEQSKRIISVGRYSEQKGFERLIDAWALIHRQHPGWHVDVFGEGELQDFLQQRIKEKGVQASFHLLPPTSDIAGEYAQSAFYVMSSRFEGFGLVLVEAMACGLPVISFDCPYGPADIISHQTDGELVPEGDVRQLSQAMSRFIDDSELRKKYGAAAKMSAQRYAIGNIMQQWVKLFENLKGNAKGSCL